MLVLRFGGFEFSFLSLFAFPSSLLRLSSQFLFWFLSFSRCSSGFPSSTSAPSSTPFSSAFLPPSAPPLPHPPVSSLPPAVSSSPFSWHPLAPVAPSASSFPSALPLSASVAPVVSAPPSFPFSLGDRRPWAPVGSLGVPGSSGVVAAPAVPARCEATVFTPPLFCPFALDPSPSSLSLRLLLLLVSPVLLRVSLLPFRFRTLPLLLLTLLLPSRLFLRTFRRILLLTLSLAFLTLVRLWLFRTPFVRSFVG